MDHIAKPDARLGGQVMVGREAAADNRAERRRCQQRPYKFPAGVRIPQRIIERVGGGMLRPWQRAQSRERVYLREAARGGVVSARAQVL